ncbi:MAG TPA: alpha/beta fold hydrolase, partial [Polyangiales bacterium]|nr:alpha/beta fold hydrolase [Polyangiales bacterium]
MAMKGCRVVVGALAMTWLAACAGQIGTEHEETEVELQSSALKLRVECKDNFNAVYKRPNGNQGGALGDIVRCNKGGRVGTAEITAALTSRQFAGLTAQKAVKLFRISYRTQRLAGQADLATALVALPAKKDVAASAAVEEDDDDEDKNKDGKRLPLVVFAHGTSPYGTACAPSKLDPLQCSTTGDNDTELVTIMALASQGYSVIAPDYAGYVEGSRAPGYLLSEDEAHSVLDATRAMNKLRQKPVDNVVLLGHSQGGHAVLSAQALAKKYGLAGKLVGVVAAAPFYAPARVLGVIGADPDLGTDPSVLAFVVEYFYTHAEVLDGAGQGKQLFKPEKHQALKDYVNQCSFTPSYCTFINPVPPSLGLASDFFQPDFFAAVAACGADKAACTASELAKKWNKRFVADRPKLDATGAPVLMWHGALDPVVPMTFGTCAYERILSDLPSKFTFCGDLYADHDQILSWDLASMMGWINARA